MHSQLFNCANSRRRRGSIELLETRCMLSANADIVFLFDESDSLDNFESLMDCLKTTVDDLETSLDNESVNTRYGLVGFGGVAHSQLIDPDTMKDDQERLWGTAANLADAVSDDLGETPNSSENGWDALEHAIAEYDFRDDAVPVFILIQNQEGRVTNTETDMWVRRGIESALKSKNVVLNSIVAGTIGTPQEPLFELTEYGLDSDYRVLGVDADIADGVRDFEHDYHVIDTTGNGSLVTSPGTTQADTLQVSYNGSNTGATGMVATGKSVVMDWIMSDGIGDETIDVEEYRAKEVPFAPETFSSPQTISNLSETSSEQLDNNSTGWSGFEFDFYGTTYFGDGDETL